MKKATKNYGKELILDLHGCDARKFKRITITRFLRELCRLIDMKRCKLTWWDDYGLPKAARQTERHLKGTSAVQFIMTSNITIHTLDLMGSVYLNIFSCKAFDAREAAAFSRKFFVGRVASATTIVRK